MDAINEKSAAIRIEATKPLKPGFSVPEAPVAHPVDKVVHSDSIEAEKVARGDFSPSPIDPPPEVKRIREAVESSVEQKRS